MPVSTWLALAGLPVFFQPFPQAADQAAVVAVASGRVGLHAPCLRLRCPGYEWQKPSTAIHDRQPAHAPDPRLPGSLPAGEQALSAPFSARRWSSDYFNDLGFGTALGLNPFRTPDTDVRLSFGPALRIQPYVDDGTARRGLVARGQVGLDRRLGDRAWLTQRISFEKGPTNTFLRNSLGVDVFLHPQWVLDSDIETIHDSVADGSGITDTSGSLNLRYSF